MFLPAWFGVVLLLGWLILSALAGALVGRVSARALGVPGPRAWADAAAGAASFVVVTGLVTAVSKLGTVVVWNGVTQGWRAVLLDHVPLWTVAAVCGAVVGRQAVAARRRPRGPADAPKPVRAPGPPAESGAPAT